MKEFVIIAGTQNSGKTTTAWCVYQRLLPYSDATQMLIGGAQVENHGEIVYKIPPYDNFPDDFKAILHIYGFTVAIISAGDVDEWLENDIEDVYSEADFIVISLRAYNRAGSSRRMIMEKYANDYTKEFWVEPNDGTLTNLADIANSKRPVADRIANYILVQTDYKQFV
jgi:hypothetical protein